MKKLLSRINLPSPEPTEILKSSVQPLLTFRLLHKAHTGVYGLIIE